MTKDSLLGLRIDEYQIEALLGKGGMARVYRGIDVRLQRYVAIKVIDSPYRGDSDHAMRFEREALAIAQLDHPHIVRLYRYGEWQGLFYIAMQYVDGADLQTVLNNYQSTGDFVEPQDANRLIREICSALDYIHQHGVIHRDIKPSNVILNKLGQAFLTDFGLALLTDIGTRGEILGSPTHVAPEQAISSARAVPQSDLYATGVILYEMFTNQLPFYSEDPLELAMLHMTQAPPSPRELRPEISPQLERVITKALAKEPAQRYQTGAELADELDQALRASEPPSPTPTDPRRSVMKLVEKQVSEQPLPPIPAAIAPPPASAMQEAQPPMPPPESKPDSSARPRRSLGVAPGVLWGALIVLVCISLTIVGIGASSLIRNRANRGDQMTGIEVTSLPSSDVVSQAPTSLARMTVEEAVVSPVPAQGSAVVLTSPMASLSPTAAPSQASSPATTPTPDPTLTPVPSPSPSPATITHILLIATRKDDSLVVVNQSDQAFPLPALRLGDGPAAIRGEEWGIASLNPGECVVAVKDKGKPNLPEVECLEVSDRVVRKSKDRFWEDDFEIYYDEERVTTCQETDDADEEEKMCPATIVIENDGG